MKNNKHLNAIELKLVEVYEAFGDCVVTEDDEGNYYVNSFSDSWIAEDKAELIEEVTTSLTEWLVNENVMDSVANGETLESVGDYLPLFLGLPNDTTVLAVGNGAVAAPSTTWAYLHTSYDGFKVLTIYDYDYQENAARMRADLEDLFPSKPPQWAVRFIFDNSDYNYSVTVTATDRAEAIRTALPIFNEDCDWHYMPYKSIEICEADSVAEAVAKAEAEKNAKIYTCDVCDSIYTGGDIWCTVYQLSGSDSDIYYAIDNTFDDFDGMAEYSHKRDRLCGSDDEYGFMETTRNITVSEMTADEKIIWLKLKLKEAETLRNEY